MYQLRMLQISSLAIKSYAQTLLAHSNLGDSYQPMLRNYQVYKTKQNSRPPTLSLKQLLRLLTSNKHKAVDPNDFTNTSCCRPFQLPSIFLVQEILLLYPPKGVEVLDGLSSQMLFCAGLIAQILASFQLMPMQHLVIKISILHVIQNLT